MQRYALAIILVLSVCIVGCMFNKPVKGSERHEFEYTVAIDLGNYVGDRSIDGGPIYNVTLILPYPCLNGTPLKLEKPSKPKGWNVSIVDTPYGKMLKIEADVIEPVHMPVTPIPIEPGETPKEIVTAKMPELNNLRIEVRVNRSVNTLSPFEEYRLNPKIDVREIECPAEEEVHYDPKKLKCYEFKTKIFAKYDGNTDVHIHIYISLEGRNTWFSYGWTGNQFREWIAIELNGSQNGWIDAIGHAMCGMGRYR